MRNIITSLTLVLSIFYFPRSALAAKDCSVVNLYKCTSCEEGHVTDCLECDGFFNTDSEKKICIDRKLFKTSDPHYRYLWNDIGAIFVWFVAAGIATACGVGGGGIYVPLGVILLLLAPKVASGLSQASIFGACLGGLALNIRNKHPNQSIREDGLTEDETIVTEGGKLYSRPLIDYDMALFLAPMQMAGAVMGVIVQKLLPNWLYLIMAGVILFFTSHKTYVKFFAAYKKEKIAKVLTKTAVKVDKEKNKNKTMGNENGVKGKKNEENDENVEISDEEENAELSSTDDSSDNDAKKSKQLTTEQILLRRQYLEADARQYPKEKLFSFLLLWMGLFVITLLKGGKGTPSLLGITCQSPWYAVLIAGQFVWTLGFASVYGCKIIKSRRAREEVNYPYLPRDVEWTPRKSQFYAIFTFFAGVVAGLIGIGGGMVLGPLMIVMGVDPRVSSATNATMIVLTSSSVAIMFVTSGMVPWEYALFFFCVCLIGAYVGKTFIDGYVKKTGMASILIFILASIIALATVGCFYNALTGLAKAKWCFDGFKPFCEAGIGNDGGCVLNPFQNSLSTP